MFSKVSNASQQTTPPATIRPNRSGARDGDPKPAPQDDRQQHDDQRRTEKAELLTRGREDEVGVRGVDRAAVDLRAVEQPGAGQPTGTDGQLGLVRVEPRISQHGRRVRMQVGGDAVHLVGAQQVQLDDHDGGHEHRDREAEHPACRHAADREHAEHDRDHHQHGAEVVLQQHQQHRNTHEHQRSARRRGHRCRDGPRVPN